jgi:Periplasmic copper-binding protein (NosD)
MSKSMFLAILAAYSNRRVLGALATLVLLLTSCSSGLSRTPDPGMSASGPSITSTPGTSFTAAAGEGRCGHVPDGPASRPSGAVRVDSAVVGDLSEKTEANPPGTVFWLSSGTHRLAQDEFAQVEPKTGNTYIGAPGAVLDGAGRNRYAFTGKARKVTLQNLTVKGFEAPVNEGVVNHDSGAGWVIENSTFVDNRGAAMMAGRGQVIRGNCVKNNGQYGLNACCGAITHLQVLNNEFVGNNADDVEAKVENCGCTGAMKLWGINGADIAGNWIHGNHGPGIWADTNNNDFLIEQNLIEDNDDIAIFYETSYNAIIRDNLIRRNNLVGGRKFADRGDDFPTPAIYLSESGGESRIKARTDLIDIYGNDFQDNWSGITLWENADRFCNSSANTSTGVCTLLVKSVSSCRPPAIKGPPLLDDCRWKTQRVEIHDNRFAFDRAAVPGCESLCGRMAVISNFGSWPRWSPYKGERVQRAITFDQQNSWYRNTYVGPWSFTTLNPKGRVTQDQWGSAPYNQDRESTFNSIGSTAVSEPTTTPTGQR